MLQALEIGLQDGSIIGMYKAFIYKDFGKHTTHSDVSVQFIKTLCVCVPCIEINTRRTYTKVLIDIFDDLVFFFILFFLISQNFLQ